MKTKYKMVFVGIFLILFYIFCYYIYTNYPVFAGFLAFFGTLAGAAIAIFSLKPPKQQKVEYKIIVKNIRDKEADLLKEKTIKLEEKTSKLKNLLHRLNNTLQEENISKEELMKALDNPLKAILLMKTSEDIPNKRYIIRSRIYDPKFGYRAIGRGVYVLPPRKTPQNIKTKREVEKFIKKTLLKGLGDDYEYIIQFASPIDLRNTFSERKVPKYRKKGLTILDALTVEDMFPPEDVLSYLKKKKDISIKDIIELPKLDFLVDGAGCSKKETEKLKNNNIKILKEIQKKENIKEIKTTNFKDISDETLIETIKNYVEEPKKVVYYIKLNASFWDSIFKSQYDM